MPDFCSPPALVLAADRAGAAELTICVKHIAHYDDDFGAVFYHGPVRVPAGAVFDFAGHAFGSATDPRDESHQDKDFKWTNITPEEQERRGKLTVEDATHNPGAGQSGLATLREVVLTKCAPCGRTEAAALLSHEWRWSVSPIFGASDFYYQLYGVIRNGIVKTDFSNDSNSFDFAGARGEINAIVSGTTTRMITLD